MKYTAGDTLKYICLFIYVFLIYVFLIVQKFLKPTENYKNNI